MQKHKDTKNHRLKKWVLLENKIILTFVKMD